MISIPNCKSALNLLMNGAKAFSQIESNGIKIDMEYLKKTEEQLKIDIQERTDELKKSKVYKVWKRRFRSKTNLTSLPQLGVVLFKELKLKSESKTSSGRYATDESVLQKLNHPFTNKYLELEKLKKAQGTYLRGIRRHVVDGYLHPSFNLNTTDTFRSSSSDPNFQNFPIRQPEVAKLIRSAFIPRDKNNHFVESDFGGIEVKGAYWYHQDPVMKKYLYNPKKDMHRDMAQQCYTIDKASQVSKQVRYCGKNMFVFPQFYGSYHIDCARNLWEAITKLKLKTTDGIPLKKVLRDHGIRKLGRCIKGEFPLPGTFEDHIRKVEKDFWKRRFKVYDQWRQDWYEAYCEKGYFDTLTGFRCQGLMRRNQVINYPVQGSAFHCLLWSVIKLNKLLRKYKMKSLIIGQIHDSIVSDVPKTELKDYIKLSEQVMIYDLKEHWKFINSPLEVEIEASKPGHSWYEKEKVAVITDLN